MVWAIAIDLHCILLTKIENSKSEREIWGQRTTRVVNAGARLPGRNRISHGSRLTRQSRARPATTALSSPATLGPLPPIAGLWTEHQAQTALLYAPPNLPAHIPVEKIASLTDQERQLLERDT
jgi:hypothetical protein